MLLYVHIPFCHRICPYCSFYKHTPGNTSIGDYIDAVLEEAKGKLPTLSLPPRTIFLGGGTPSMLSPSHLRKLFTGLQQMIDFSTLDEVSLEANPATFDLEKARLFRSLGVQRVSLGIQSFDAAVLQTLGREHDPEQARRSVEILQQAQMPAVNIDLMFSIPGQSLESWQDTLASAIELKPQHISAYNLTYEEDTAFFQALLQGEMHDDPQRNNAFFYAADEQLRGAGFEHYETSNYAQPTFRSSHNQGYWRGEDYLGLGPSAVSTFGGVRSKNIADTAQYIAMIGSVGHAGSDLETLNAEDVRLERIAMGLRTSEGIPLSILDEDGQQRALFLAEQGLLICEAQTLSVTRTGAALVDAIAGEIV